jgi:hypothetical protein
MSTAGLRGGIVSEADCEDDMRFLALAGGGFSREF